MAEMEKKEVAEEEQSLMEKVTILDFDMLCATVAMQNQKGKWDKLNMDEYDEEEEGLIYANGNGGGGVFRMWEGELVNDCFDDRRIALQSACCPCYRFGKNMKRAGFGSCFLQGSVYVSLCLLVLVNILAFLVTRRHCFLYLGAGFTILVGLYLGMYRTQIRKKFNISESDGAFDDCVYHLVCPCCSLCQESRTLEMNNVQDGIWHGRGDTICIGSYSEGVKAYIERSPPPVMFIHPPEPQISSKSTQETTHSVAPTFEPTSPVA
ncbi:OLC1v1021792C1 [Oldenlandia corymbosa var. corymbosa]|uniref:OLC1v1021792C1 n=1 Tax=Oldenlandia corymbosa var. corymbosa TaxID=529605 RepID=A0AAV1BXT2_OLDCO|nr:OLC1v1021792C1 [Oldenlandia corymbosa var. corymbosa]